MKISDIQIASQPLVLASPAEVEALESQWWITFPAGYREYVTELGEGVLGGSLVRIYPPWRIAHELNEWRRRIATCWRWGDCPEPLPSERARECVLVGDTLDGDELVFHPHRPNKLFVLPRHSETVLVAGDDLLAAIDWICGSGELVEPFSERIFEPFDSRLESADRSVLQNDVTDPEGESLNDLVELAQQWAKRHAARTAAQKDLNRHSRDGKRTRLQFEALMPDGEYPYIPSYVAAYGIDDAATRLEVGTLVFQWNDASHGSFYLPHEANQAKLKNAKE